MAGWRGVGLGWRTSHMAGVEATGEYGVARNGDGEMGVSPRTDRSARNDVGDSVRWRPYGDEYGGGADDCRELGSGSTGFVGTVGRCRASVGPLPPDSDSCAF